MIPSSSDKKICKACISKIICQGDQMMLKHTDLASYIPNRQDLSPTSQIKNENENLTVWHFSHVLVTSVTNNFQGQALNIPTILGQQGQQISIIIIHFRKRNYKSIFKFYECHYLWCPLTKKLVNSFPGSYRICTHCIKSSRSYWL